ncbi:MAG: MJ0042-type zinc finger domain-containing protein [Janthinobacterium lividum]
MHVLCPSCAAQYDIPRSQMIRPRLLRCARCNTEWRMPPVVVQEAGPVADALPIPMPTPPPAIDPVALPMQPLVSAPIAPSGARRGAVLWIVLWLLSLIVIVAGLYALWHWRGAIGHRWPPSLRLLRMLPGTGRP